MPRVAAVAWLLCGSGCCALVYQVGWLREFRLIFGASTAASAAVLAIFIGGLGIGGLLLGPRADADDRPLRFYSTLELIVAATAALSPLLLDVARAIYLATGGSTALGMPLATVERLLLSAIVLAVPTIAMGGTLPAAARAVTLAKDVRRQHLAMLYAANTIGAVERVREIWTRIGAQPRDPSELAMAADLEAEAGSEATAAPLIEQLRAYQPAEADTILAALRLRQSRPEEAVAALESALTRMRVDPWPLRRYKQKALTLTAALMARAPASSPRLFAALEPFVPWTSGFLLARRDCYQATSDARLADANRDLEDYFAREPAPLAVR